MHETTVRRCGAWWIASTAVLLAAGCTIHHSRQALWADAMDTPSADATFVTEEDSGLTLLGLFPVADADHYAVLLTRMHRRHNCARIHHAQLDYFTDYWLIVGFPIARLTAVCEHAPAEASVAEARREPPEPEPEPAPAPAPAPEDPPPTEHPLPPPDTPEPTTDPQPPGESLQSER